ncbi:hypothetical protein BDA96_07G094600 [Sorghum bicolor]|uniref:MADS-box domain-containing protein n=1 Tax=Sorghum bicolor TaxID=4558 RepID=A0A921QJ42_SORBI|nr:hypothetical protein BDA96_07G094600 [Sorghum bicolor]
MVKGKSTKGRQRIEMKTIKGEEARQVSFSKRRPSLFKKASELSTLCGAEVAIVTFSPGGRCFSFGHPSTLSVADRFLVEHTLDGLTIGSGSHGTQGLTGTSHEMNHQVMELQQLMETEKRSKERAVEAMKRESQGPVMQLLNANVGALGLQELEVLRKDLYMVHDMVKKRSHEVLEDAMRVRRPPPQPRMHMVAMPSQVFFGGQSAGTMYTTFPSLSNGPRKGVHVNSLLHGSLGGLGNYFNGQFGG